MQATPATAHRFETGQRMTRAEFLAAWDELDIKRAELIEGTVYVTPPISNDHGAPHLKISTWLGVYEAGTPGCSASIAPTVFMLDDAPQPDALMMVLPDHGGQARFVNRKGSRFLEGAPELAVEVSLSTRQYDLKKKKNLYAAAGVTEYLNIQPERARVTWFRLQGKIYRELPTVDGLIHSVVFPGLWLDCDALLSGDTAKLLRRLNDGLNAPEHAAFVERLAAQKLPI